MIENEQGNSLKKDILGMVADIPHDLLREIMAEAEDYRQRENARMQSINRSVDNITADLKKAADDMADILKMLTR